MTSDTLAARVSADDTRAFSVTLSALKEAYLKAQAADIDVISAMWMNICMDCTPTALAASPEVAKLIAAERARIVEAITLGFPPGDRFIRMTDALDAIEAAALKGA